MHGSTQRLRVTSNRHADPDINGNFNQHPYCDRNTNVITNLNASFNLNSASIADGHTITNEHADRDGAASDRRRTGLSDRRKRCLRSRV